MDPDDNISLIQALQEKQLQTEAQVVDIQSKLAQILSALTSNNAPPVVAPRFRQPLHVRTDLNLLPPQSLMETVFAVAPSSTLAKPITVYAQTNSSTNKP